MNKKPIAISVIQGLLLALVYFLTRNEDEQLTIESPLPNEVEMSTAASPVNTAEQANVEQPARQ